MMYWMNNLLMRLGLYQDTSSALQFTDRAIRFVHFKRGRGNIRLRHFHEVELPQGIIKNGEVHDMDNLTHIIRSLRKQFHIRRVAVGLPEALFFVTYLYVPKNRNESPHATIRRSLEQFLASRFSQQGDGLTCEYDIINEEARGSLIHVTVNTSESVHAYDTVITKAGIRAVSFSASTHGIVHLHSPSVSDGAYIAVHVNQLGGHVSLVNKGVVVRSTGRRFFGESGELEKIGRLVRDIYQQWTHKRYPNSFERAPIVEVVVYGDGVSGDHARKVIMQTSGLPVVHPEVWHGISFDREVPHLHARDTVRYAPVIGLAISQLNR